jgi:tetratricopeptide (TPR) repeat protein
MKLSFTITIFGIFLFIKTTAQTVSDRSKLIQFYQNEDYASAVEWLLSISAEVSDKVQYNNDLGYSFYMDDRPEEALELFKKNYHLQPSNVMASLYLARLYSNRKEMDSALFFYNNLISSQPKNYRFWQKAGLIFYQKNNLDSAGYYFMQAFSINPRSGPLTNQLADVWIRQKQMARADSLLQNFLAIDSSVKEVIAKRIDLSYKLADYATAIKWGEKLWNDSIDVTLPYINLAWSYLASDSIDKCISLTEWLTNKNKTSQSLTYCAALAHAKKKNYEKSNTLLDDCLKQSIQEDAILYFNAKSDNYESLKQYQNAIRYYDTSYYIFQSALDLYYTGRIYDKYFNNRAKANIYYKQFLDKRKNPRNSGEKRVFDYIIAYLKQKG